MKNIIYIIVSLLIYMTSEFSFACSNCKIKIKRDNFLAASGIPFKKLMTDSMHIMDLEMDKVDFEKKNEEVFLRFMIAHHQGAIDMANSLLVHSKDLNLQNYAKSIISSQYNEIVYMKTFLEKYAK